MKRYGYLVLNAWIKLVKNGDRVFALQLHPVVQVAVGAGVALLGYGSAVTVQLNTILIYSNLL